ncbi:superoxide dismutase family protein [Salirhabdus sp. Marseille-P4669]|uniref:superoxide dismutase family protein n=1 Tax=Salirhabdus sp. Marseille-P4669 TaxID=2042310 RepID=UPI000C7DD640|nr:superoxide dismutase family protein [Salirhabdus sp. Marseille-P4669]
MMKVLGSFLLSIIMFLTACTDNTRSPMEITVYNPDGDSVGTATLSDQPDGVKVALKLAGLPPGMHGIHIHEFPKCEGPDFKSAGNHVNPDSKLHGLMHPEGSHLGDLPNVEVDDKGKLETEVTVQQASLKDDKYSLLKGEGTSLVITEGLDDGMTQPSGNSGARIACGQITLKEDDKSESPSNPIDDGPQKEE